MWKIKKSVLINAISASNNFMPDEFMCFLGGNKKEELIHEIVFLPTHNNETSASINEYTIPFDDSIVGTLHSHPNGSSSPSTTDKKFFRKYSLNAILGYPFFIENISFYNEKGENTQISLIED
ncbi:MAG: Mov34/MPN/PAD-1 family protein [archaeon]|jgi:proteasome lid subunit RPN8/RPN11